MLSVMLFIGINILVIVIGYRAFRLFREEGTSPRETLFQVILALFIYEVTSAFVLALLGVYSLWLIIVLVLAGVTVVAIVACKNRKNDKKKHEAVPLLKGMNYGLLAVLIVAGFLYSVYPTYYMWARRDPAIYLINGINIAETGSSQLPDNELIDEQYADLKDFIYLSYRGIYSDYEEGDSTIPSEMTSQFLHFFPAALAMGYSVAGLEGLVRVNAVIGLLCILMVYYFCKKAFDRRTATIAAVLLAVNPAQLWCVRITQTEALFQLFVFAGLYLFWVAWKKEKVIWAVGAGLLLGFTGLNRIDSYILGVGIFCLACYANLWLRKYQKLSNALAISYGIAAVISLVYSYAFSKYYVVSHWQAGVLSAVVICNLGLAACASIACYMGRWKRFSKHNLIQYFFEKENRRASLFVISIAIFAMVYMLRPLLQGGSNPDWDFNQRALVEFFWYTSVIVVPLFFYGLWEIAGESERRKELLLFLAIGLSNFLVYIYKPAVASDHPWASRRWVSVAFPFVLITVAWALTRLPRILTFKEEMAGKLRSLLVVLLVGYAVYQSRLFLLRPMLSELPEQYDVLAELLDDDILYVAQQSHFASILRFVYGKNVVVLKEDSTGEIYNYLQGDNRAVYYIGDMVAVEGQLYYTPLFEQELKGTYIKQTVGEYPNDTMIIGGETNIYRIEAVDDAEDLGKGEWIKRIIDLDRMCYMADATRYGNGYESSENAGYFMFGPYWNLREGNYYVEVELETYGTLPNRDICLFEATCDSGQHILAQKSVQGHELEERSIRIYFNLDEPVDNVEFRIYKKDGYIVNVQGISYGFEKR